jgi:putative tryptophan/tyrosine transport system substrate-binding protein
MLLDQLQRRNFITLLGGAAAWPLAARAQQGEQVRRIGVLTVFSKEDPEGQRRVKALLQRLNELGWTDGRNLRIEFRWADGDPDRSRFYAGELVGMKPDVIFVNHGLVLSLLRRETRTIPIVFVQFPDPVADGIVASLAQPGGNITGFTTGEYAIGGKKLEVLKELAPDVGHVTVILDPGQSSQIGVSQAIETAAPSVQVRVTVAGVRDGSEIERAILAASRDKNAGLIVIASGVTNAHRREVIELAARHRLPAVYDFRYFVAEGGLASYGHDPADQYRQAAVYIDRILRGTKAGELPVQNPTKYELVINLKTVKLLGLTIPESFLLRADEVID